VDLGKVEALLLPSEQIPNESYAHGVRLKVYITEVRKTTKGPQVLVSRTHPTLLKRLFELEVPEIHDGTVEIKGISREPGNRAKISVYCKEDNIDPVGACVGPRGMRVQSVVRELRGEKIDIIPWDPDPKKYVANALSPARVVRVFLDEEEKIARVVVPDDQLSLAIGKEGQNARLAAKLTGWKIDIKSETQMAALVLSGEDWEERTSKTTRDDEEPLVEPEEEEILPPEPEDSHKKKDDEWEERERRHVHSPRKKEKRRVLRDLSELTLIDFDFDE
jgi:N utilization substance protein A